jgi:AraC-like DNA-binding protein
MKPRNNEESAEARLSPLLDDLGRRISNILGSAGESSTAFPGLSLYRCTSPTMPNACTYEPSLLLIPQGKKRVDLGKTHYTFGQSHFLLTSVQLPVISRVVSASGELPYLAFFLKLDISTVRDVLNTDAVSVSKSSPEMRAMGLGLATPELVRSCSRIMELLEAPQDIPFLGNLLQREVIYRLLQGTQGERLRAIAAVGGHVQRTGKAVAWLSANYEKPLRVEELAKLAGMGLSTLHSHFRELTGMSPLQYQKQLRLRRARQRLLMEEIDAATAAFEVGYESPSQFNREYRRFFGQPPIRDIKALRDRKVVAITAA